MPVAGQYSLIWLGAVLAYGLFWFWYGAARAPLTLEEITKGLADYAQLDIAGHDSAQQVKLGGLLASDDGREIFTVHLVRMRADPEAVEGLRVRQMSSFDVLRHFRDLWIWKLYAQASYPYLIAPVKALPLSAWGASQSMTAWTHIAVIRHRSRRDLMNLLNDPLFAKQQRFLSAAIETQSTFVIAPLTQFLMLRPEIIMAWIIFALAALVQIIALVQNQETDNVSEV